MDPEDERLNEKGKKSDGIQYIYAESHVWGCMQYPTVVVHRPTHRMKLTAAAVVHLTLSVWQFVVLFSEQFRDLLLSIRGRLSSSVFIRRGHTGILR